MRSRRHSSPPASPSLSIGQEFRESQILLAEPIDFTGYEMIAQERQQRDALAVLLAASGRDLWRAEPPPRISAITSSSSGSGPMSRLAAVPINKGPAVAVAEIDLSQRFPQAYIGEWNATYQRQQRPSAYRRNIQEPDRR